MKGKRPAIFKGRHFEPEIIATCVRWYLRFSLSLRNVEEMMAERGLIVGATSLALGSKVDIMPQLRREFCPVLARGSSGTLFDFLTL